MCGCEERESVRASRSRFSRERDGEKPRPPARRASYLAIRVHHPVGRRHRRREYRAGGDERGWCGCCHEEEKRAAPKRASRECGGMRVFSHFFFARRVHRQTRALHRPENPPPQRRVRSARHTLMNSAGAMAGRAPAEQPASPAAAVLAHNLNLPPGAHAFILSAALTWGLALSGARAAAGEAGTRSQAARPSLVAPQRPPPPPAAASAPERPPPPPPPAERNPEPPQAVPPRPDRAVPPRTARLRIGKHSVTHNKQ